MPPMTILIKPASSLCNMRCKYCFDISGKGTFDKVINTAKLFDKYKVEYNILCVVNNYVERHSNQVKVFTIYPVP